MEINSYEKHFYSILIVDPEAHLRIMIREILTRSGVVFVECASIDEALKAFRSIAFDVVIISSDFPEDSDMDFLPTVQKHTKHILITTTQPMLKDVTKKAKSMGINEILKKPFFPHELRECMNRLSDVIHFSIPTLIRRRTELLPPIQPEDMA